MKSFVCRCGNAVFFENSSCVACGSELGWCPACLEIRSLTPVGDHYQCAEPSCGVDLVKCHNYAVEQVCNRCTPLDPGGEALCDYCRYNHTIPDLSIVGNRAKWRRLEIAKRRLLRMLDLLGLPHGTETDGIEPPLSFAFAEDVTHDRWWSMQGGAERVFTGHAQGRITINLREADPVEREKARSAFQEAHRTVIGHFRHEIGHYYWDMLVAGRRDDAFRELFGDHENPPYDAAIQAYYDQGPRPDWPAHHVSAYASMHPWEDFAETFATYLDMASILDTARHMGLGPSVDLHATEVRELVAAYAKLGVALNEMNRAMGLVDLVPEVLNPNVVEKMAFVHELVREASASSGGRGA